MVSGRAINWACDGEEVKRMQYPRIILGALLFVGSSVKSASANLSPWQITLQEPASPVMERMTEFHNLLLIIISGIVLFVLSLLIYVIVKFNSRANPIPSQTTHNTWVEVIWTVAPVLILLVIAVPSFRLLYYQDRTHNPELTVKVVGMQWNWAYEFPDQNITRYSSLYLPDQDLAGRPRLLATDEPLVLPIDTDVQLLITGDDVMHGFNVPAFGVRTDVIPGRVNETWVRITHPGTYYGECSQICGTGHSLMPIEVRAVSRSEFNEWASQRSLGQPQLLTLASVPSAAQL
jgi:cytochrome c oxidase subunit 2